MQGMFAHVCRPVCEQRFQTRAVVGEQGPDGLLEAGQIAGQRRHEVVGTFVALGRIVRVGASRLLHQLAQGHRRAPLLCRQPVPVPRQQGDFAGDDTEFRPAAPTQLVATAGNMFASNDRDNPDTNFETADDMGQAAVWICEQPADKYTGQSAYDKDLLNKAGIELKGPFH